MNGDANEGLKGYGLGNPDQAPNGNALSAGKSKIEELEKILKGDGQPEIDINPDGSLTTKPPLYIGTKIVRAEPMTKQTFDNRFKQIVAPENEEDMGGYLVVYEDGYKSWSPKEVFERCYRLISPQEKKIINQ